MKATCCLSVTLFHCPVLTAEKTSECHGRNEKGKHSCVSLFRCDLNASLVCMADSMRPQLNTFYLAMKTYLIRLPMNRMLNSHPIFLMPFVASLYHSSQRQVNGIMATSPIFAMQTKPLRFYRFLFETMHIF